MRCNVKLSAHTIVTMIYKSYVQINLPKLDLTIRIVLMS